MTDQDIEIKKEDLEEVALQIQNSSQIVLTEITQAIQTMSTEFYQLKVIDIEDKEGLEAVHTARMIVKNTRVAIDKRRQELNEDALKRQRNNNAAAKHLTGLITPVETYLQDQEDIVEKAKAFKRAEQLRIEQERLQKEADDRAAAKLKEQEDLLAQRRREIEIEAEEARRERDRIDLQHQEDLRIQKEEQDRKDAELAEKQARLDQADKDRLIWEEQVAKEQAEIKEERRKLEEQKAAAAIEKGKQVEEAAIALFNEEEKMRTPVEAQINQLEHEAQKEETELIIIKKATGDHIPGAPIPGFRGNEVGPDWLQGRKEDKEKLLYRLKTLTEYSQDLPPLITQEASDIWHPAAREIESAINNALKKIHNL